MYSQDGTLIASCATHTIVELLQKQFSPDVIAELEAAPDLLAACRVIVLAERDWQGKCAAAIAKAEGN